MKKKQNPQPVSSRLGGKRSLHIEHTVKITSIDYSCNNNMRYQQRRADAQDHNCDENTEIPWKQILRNVVNMYVGSSHKDASITVDAALYLLEVDDE